MQREQIAQLIRGYLRDAMPGLDIDFDALSPHEQLWDLIGSLNLMELVEYIEKSFKFEVAPLDYVPENFASIDLIVEYVATELQSKGR